MTASSNSPESEGATDSARSASIENAQTDVGTQRVGVLSTHNSKVTKAILNAVRVLRNEPVWIRDENATSWIEDGIVQLSSRVDVLVNRMLFTESDHQLKDLQLASLYEETTPVINPPQAVMNTLHKYRAGAQLATADLPVPDAYFGRSPQTFEEWPEYLPDDAAHKHTVGTNGQDMSIVSPNEPVSPMINDEHSVIQEFLEDSDDRPSDVRVYVVGGGIVGSMRRHAPEGDWRTNVAVGGKVEGITDELGDGLQRVYSWASSFYDRAYTRRHSGPGLQRRFGRFGSTRSSRYCVKHSHAKDSLRESFHGSSRRLSPYYPCKPQLIQEDDDDGVFGYTKRIRINGRNEAEQAVAKSDTGAKRTSIDTDLAGQIGAGPLVGTTHVRSGTGSETEIRPLVDVDLCLDGRWQTVTASITDRSEMTYPVLLGRDVLEAYTLDISRAVEE